MQEYLTNKNILTKYLWLFCQCTISPWHFQVEWPPAAGHIGRGDAQGNRFFPTKEGFIPCHKDLSQIFFEDHFILGQNLLKGYCFREELRTVVNWLSLHKSTVSTVGQNTNSDLPSNKDWFSKHPSIRHSLLFQLKMLEGMSPMLTSLQTTRSNPGETIASIEQINH